MQSKAARKAYMQSWYLKNQTAQRKRNNEYVIEIKTKCFALFGSKCKIYGFEDIRALQLDHINGGGHQEGLQGQNLYRAILFGKRKTDDLQLLCANHNVIKRFENKEHKKFNVAKV